MKERLGDSECRWEGRVVLGEMLETTENNEVPAPSLEEKHLKQEHH